MKFLELRRNKNRNIVGLFVNGVSLGYVIGRKRKFFLFVFVVVVFDLNNLDGFLFEFACKVCGRLVVVDFFFL